MAVTQTAAQLLQRLLRHYPAVGDYVPNAQIGALAAGSFTSVYLLRGTATLGVDHYYNKGTIVWRPGNATGIADDVRYAANLTASTGVLAIDTNWADTTLGTEDLYLIYNRVHPQALIDAANVALGDVYWECEHPLSFLGNPVFEGSGGEWTATSTVHTRLVTADSVNIFPTFVAGGQAANSAANGHITQELATIRSAEWFTAAILRVDVGTFELVWRDVTNSVDLGSPVTTTEEDWVYAERCENVASSTETLGIRLQGDESTADIFYACAWAYPTTATFFRLATAWDSRFKMPVLSYLTFEKSLSSGVYEARSVRRHKIPESDYDFLISRPGANPYAIQFHTTRWLRYPIMIEGRRALSDVDGPFARTLAETTGGDPDLFIAAWGRRLFEDDSLMIPERPILLAKAQDELGVYSRQAITHGPSKESKVRWREVSA